jgi:hypothetical protein
MARNSTRHGHRITLQLDTRITLEAIILNRMERIPKARRQEWLRGLLVQGFRVECRVLREVPRETEPNPVTAFTRWLAKDMPSTAAPPEQPRVGTAGRDHAPGSGKPFAGLSKVIG